MGNFTLPYITYRYHHGCRVRTHSWTSSTKWTLIIIIIINRLYLPDVELLLADEDSRRRVPTTVAVATLTPPLGAVEPLQMGDGIVAADDDFDWLRRFLLMGLQLFVDAEDKRF